MEKPKPRFASSASPSANRFFSSFLVKKKKKKKLAKGPQSDGQTSLSYLVGPAEFDFFMLSPHWLAFQALIPP